MARKYDIIARLKAKNEKPFITIDAEHSYEINTEKTNVMSIMALMDDSENKNPLEQMKLTDKVIKMALGAEALKYINSLPMTTSAEILIIEAIMAGISDVDLDEVKKAGKK